MTTIQQLIEDNMNLVHHCIRKFYPTFIGNEDMISIGMLGLCKAANCYSPEKGKFSSLACQCIINEFKAEFRKRRNEPQIVSLDHCLSHDAEDGDALIDSIVGEEDVGFVDFEGWFAQLNPRAQEIIRLKMAGLSQKEISKLLNLNRQTVSKEARKALLLWRKRNK